MADLCAADRASAAGAPLRAEHLGPEGGRPAAARIRPLARAVGDVMSDNHYDVIIIGTGAGGGTLARHLAPSGKRVLLLERGGWLPREPQNVSAEEVFVNGRYTSADT